MARLAEPLATHLHEYLLLGVLPEPAMVGDLSRCRRLLREDVVDKVLERDVAALYGLRRGMEGDLIAELGDRIVPFEVNHHDAEVTLERLKGMRLFPEDRKVQPGTVITLRWDDFWVLASHRPAPGTSGPGSTRRSCRFQRRSRAMGHRHGAGPAPSSPGLGGTGPAESPEPLARSRWRWGCESRPARKNGSALAS